MDHKANLAAIAEICDGVTTAVHFYDERKDELAQSIRAVLHANEALANSLRSLITVLETVDADERQLAREERRTAHVHTSAIDEARAVLNHCTFSENRVTTRQ